MFAQKTTELLRRIRRYESIGYTIKVINYAHDTRYGTNCISSHDLDKYPATPLHMLSDVGDLSGVNVIIIDEAQFFPDLYESVTKWADTLPIHIVVCGLDGDSERKPFGDILRLFPHAEEVVRLSSYCAHCRDGTPAYYSKRIDATAEQIAIGGKDMYAPVCRKHYLSA